VKRIAAFTAALSLATVLPTAVTTEAGTGRCPQYETLLTQLAPKGGWDVKRMSRYMWRESRCTPNVRSRTRDSGLLQINDVNLPWLSSKLHRRITPAALMDPTTNVRAAARLCEYGRRAWGNCYQPWSL